MKLEQSNKVNVILLASVNLDQVAESKESKQWLKKLTEYLKDQFLNRKWAYNLTMLALLAFPAGRFVIAMINALLDEAAREASKKQR